MDKVELELLRGESIGERVPASDVPCNETSDRARLCTHPVVSVAMLAYKHEKFVAQAIESIVSQKTDFEFELIIAEDASPDRTREIAFEYQKKYPDKIRVLWSEKNLNHIAGNGIRLWARCRGEFVALCEGDDYWIDPLKLQKQVEVMRIHPNVSLCFSSAKYTEMNSDRLIDSTYVNTKFKAGVIPGGEFVAGDPWLITCTALYRNAVYREAEKKFLPFNWRLFMRDKVLWFGLALLGEVYCFHERFGVYRNHSGGATKTHWPEICRDVALVMCYYASIFPGKFERSAEYYALKVIEGRSLYISSMRNPRERFKAMRLLFSEDKNKKTFLEEFGRIGFLFLCLGSPFGKYVRFHSWLWAKFNFKKEVK